ncbi:cytochrome P450 [Rhodococcus koreensis]|uniref:cytochrome P450 n=2 Tax=Rhodococcus koreensis TaxID=99653 RepID=UPI0036D8FF84
MGRRIDSGTHCRESRNAMNSNSPSIPAGCPAHASSVDSAVAELMTLDPDRVRCPYPVYEQLRQEAPVYWSERLQSYVVSRYADIAAILTKPKLFSSIRQSGPSSVTALAQRLIDDADTPELLKKQAARRLDVSGRPTLINADPPVHVRQRKLVSQGFSPRRVVLMEPEVRQIASDLFDKFEARGSMDFVADFALPLPMTVIANVLGVPPSRMADFKRWSDAFTRGVGALDLSIDQIQQIFGAVDEFYDYFTEQIEERRTEPRDDLLTDIVAARLDGEQPLLLNEMLHMLSVFLVGGNETTTNLLTAITLRLLTDDELMTRIRNDASLIPKLVEEVVRLESPVQGLFRTATENTELNGTPIPEGSMIWTVFASGNRDPEAITNPDDIELDGPNGSNHLAFGKGEHVCMGASVARLEARIGIEMMLERFPNLRLASDELPPVHNSFILHGLQRLDVVNTPR